MKKILTLLLCAILFVVIALSMTACDDKDTQKNIDELQAQLLQQQQQLDELQAQHIQQQEHWQQLEDLLHIREESLNTIIATGSTSSWHHVPTAYLVTSKETLQQMLDDFSIDNWSYRTKDGIEITKEFFDEQSLDLLNKALIVSLFSSPSGEVNVTRHYLWKSADVLHVGIDYTRGGWQLVTSVMVITEIDRDYISNVNDVFLDLNHKLRK